MLPLRPWKKGERGDDQAPKPTKSPWWPSRSWRHCQFVYTCSQSVQMCVQVAVDLSNIFLSRCMKHSVPCGLMKHLAAGWSCYWLQSEMWSGLSEIPRATAFGVLHSQPVWSGQEFE